MQHISQKKKTELPSSKKENKFNTPLANNITPSENNWLIGVLLFAFAFLLYANTLGHGYAFDDSIVITENAFTKQGLAGIKDLVTKDFFEGIYGNESMQLSGGRYRPLSLVMFAIEYEFFGLNPFIGHLLNILFYALSGILLWHLSKRWFASFEYGNIAALFIALIFIAHPIHTEVVANIKSRDEIMAVFFLLLSLLSMDKYFKTANKVHILLIGFNLFLSMLSKEHTFIYAMLMPIIAMVFYKEEPIEKRILPTIIAFSAAIIYFILRYSMVGGFGAENPDIMENPFVQSDFNEKFGTIGFILFKYLQNTIFPWQMSSDYSFNQIPFVGLSNPIALLGWGIFAFLGLWALNLIFRKKHYFGFAILAFILPLGPTTNILFNIGAPMADRFLYVSTLGSSILLGGFLASKLSAQNFNIAFKKPLTFVFLAFIGAYSLSTVMRNPVWENNLTLFGNDVKVASNSAKMQYYYGSSLLKFYLENTQSSQAPSYLANAKVAFEKAVQINPQFHTAWYNLALVAWSQQDGQAAAQYCEKVLMLQPRHILTTELYGKVQARFLNNPQKSIQLLETAIYTYNRNTPENYAALAIAYAMSSNFDKAINLMETAISLNELDKSLWHNYAGILQQSGRAEAAAKAMQKAQSLQ